MGLGFWYSPSLNPSRAIHTRTPKQLLPWVSRLARGAGGAAGTAGAAAGAAGGAASAADSASGAAGAAGAAGGTAASAASVASSISASLFRVDPANAFASLPGTQCPLDALPTELRERLASGEACGSLDTTWQYVDDDEEEGGATHVSGVALLDEYCTMRRRMRAPTRALLAPPAGVALYLVSLRRCPVSSTYVLLS